MLAKYVHFWNYFRVRNRPQHGDAYPFHQTAFRPNIGIVDALVLLDSSSHSKSLELM